MAKLQTEKQKLQLQLRSLQHHLSLHKLHVISACDTKEVESRKGVCQDAFRLLEERRRVLIDCHSTSVHGSHAGEYRALFAEHVQLEDQFRHVAASRTVVRYSLQKLIIDVVRERKKYRPQMVCGLG